MMLDVLGRCVVAELPGRDGDRLARVGVDDGHRVAELVVRARVRGGDWAPRVL